MPTCRKQNNLRGLVEKMIDSGRLIYRVLGPFIHTGGMTLLVFGQKQVRQGVNLRMQFVLFSVIIHLGDWPNVLLCRCVSVILIR